MLEWFKSWASRLVGRKNIQPGDIVSKDIRVGKHKICCKGWPSRWLHLWCRVHKGTWWERGLQKQMGSKGQVAVTSRQRDLCSTVHHGEHGIFWKDFKDSSLRILPSLSSYSGQPSSCYLLHLQNKTLCSFFYSIIKVGEQKILYLSF